MGSSGRTCWLLGAIFSSAMVFSNPMNIPITADGVIQDKCLELCSVESKRNHYQFQQCLIDCNNNIPGPPMIRDIDGIVYKIYWEPANSSRIELYSLEGLYSKTSDIFAELIELEEEQEKEALENPGGTNEQFVEEPLVKSDNWKVVCNTTQTFCKIEDLYHQNILSFRVRAMNLKGWGPYVYSRQPIDEPTDRGHLIIATFLPAIMVCTSVFFCFIYVCVSKLHKRRIRHKRDTLPHWAQFHQVEYAFPRMLTDSEIGVLPEFQDTNLKNLKYLGRGIFSSVQVFQGIILTDEKPTPVTIKKLQNGASDNLKRVFYQEAFILNNVNHENILKLIGVSFGHTVNIAFEDISKKKNLLAYLRSTTVEDGETKIEKPAYKKLLNFCKEMASACAYLERCKYIHRDIACRSFYLFENNDTTVVKLVDFTIINSENKSDFFEKHGILYPIRWMAPESLHYGIYSIKTNVWAFGVACWEVMTYGSHPYHGKDIYDVINFVRNGKRLDCPEICTKTFYDFLITTWRPEAESRPSFKNITTNLLYL